MLSADVIDNLEERFGVVWVSGDAQEVYVRCPFCPKNFGSEDKTGHLALNFGRNKGHCVRCDQGLGDVAAWLKARFNYIVPFFSLPKLSSLSSLFAKKVKPKKKFQTIPMPVGTKPLPLSKWGKGDFSASLVKKKITVEDAEDHYISYCNEGRFGNYTIFPFIEEEVVSYEDLKPVYWQGRAIYSDQEYRKINPSKSSVAMGKSHWLYGYHLVKDGGVIYITEGNLDAISTNRFLKRNFGDGHFSVSIQGTALSFPTEDEHPENSQFGKILAKHPSKVVILLDADAKKKSDALGNLLSLCGLNVSLAHLKNGDPNESDDEQLLQAIKPQQPLSIIEEDFLSLPKF